MAVVPLDVKTAAPEFAALDDAVVQAEIDRAERRTNRAAWGVKADDSVTYLAAHLLTVQQASGKLAPGPVSSLRVGDVAKTYAVPTALSGADATLASTKWGRQYLDLRGTVFADRQV